MRFPIKQRSKLPKPEAKKIQGLGDVVEKVAEPIKKALMKIPSEQLQHYLSMCNCEERKKWLNDHFSFRKK